MHPFSVDSVLKTMVVLIDTREHPTAKFAKRIEQMGTTARRKLNFGDYSAAVMFPSGEEFTLQDAVCVERKMNIDELCSCFCQERVRFTREFERAQRAGAKIYLLVENASWERIYSGDYHSQMSPKALEASLNTWAARYNCPVVFCKPETTGKLIKDILYREMKERLTSYEPNVETRGGDVWC